MVATAPGAAAVITDTVTAADTVTTDTVLASAPVQAPSSSGAIEPKAVPAIPDVTQIGDAAPAEAAAPQGSTGILGLHSDITFSVFSAPRKHGDEALAAYEAQVKRIAIGLQGAARGLYPDAVKRIGAFDVYVADSAELSAMSSGTGRIAVNAGFSSLNPTDDWLAFVIAREMGHVVAGHHDSNAGASLAVSVLMNLIVPGSGLIKSAISFAGSQMASSSGREKQVKEADEVAMKLLEAAGYTSKSVALNLRLNPIGEQVSTTSWATAFRASSERLTATLPGKAPAAQPAMQEMAAPLADLPRDSVPVMQAEASSQSAPPPPAVRQVRWQPEELVRARPSGLPGPLLLGGNAVPVRRVE